MMKQLGCNILYYILLLAFKHLFNEQLLAGSHMPSTGAYPEGPPMFNLVSQMAMSCFWFAGKLFKSFSFHSFTLIRDLFQTYLCCTNKEGARKKIRICLYTVRYPSIRSYCFEFPFGSTGLKWENELFLPCPFSCCVCPSTWASS